MGFFNVLGDAAAGSLGGGIVGMALSGIKSLFGSSRADEERRALRMMEKQMALQAKYNREQADYSSELAKDMWNYTNYENQVEHMKNAGLNPALMYKGAGAGGSASGAGTAAPVNGGDGLLGLQAKLIQSQINKTEAETAKTAAEAGNITKNTEKTEWDISKTKFDTMKAQNEIDSIRKHNRLLDYNIDRENFEKARRDAIRQESYGYYINGNEVKRESYFELYGKTEIQKLLADLETAHGVKEENSYKEKYYGKLKEFINELADGEIYKARAEEIKYLREGNQKEYELWAQKQDMALSKALDQLIEGSGEYTGILLKAARIILNAIKK